MTGLLPSAMGRGGEGRESCLLRKGREKVPAVPLERNCPQRRCRSHSTQGSLPLSLLPAPQHLHFLTQPCRPPCSAWPLHGDTRTPRAALYWRQDRASSTALPLGSRENTESRVWPRFQGHLLPIQWLACWFASPDTRRPHTRERPRTPRLGLAPTYAVPHRQACWPLCTPGSSSRMAQRLHQAETRGASPGARGHGPTSMRPVSGWKLRAGSSVVTRHWMAQPLMRIFSCRRPRSGRLRPSATWIWAWTRSTLQAGRRQARQGA